MIIKENGNLRVGMGKRKERMSAKRYILKGHMWICSEENMQKLEGVELVTKKKEDNGLCNANGKRQKRTESRNAY